MSKTDHEFFVPIYKYGNPDTGADTTFGTNIYNQIDDLFMFEPDAVGYFVVKGSIVFPTVSGAV